jgi:glyoxylase-like metal-dependent hydrolase (beta-lactamase superfamily II)
MTVLGDGDRVKVGDRTLRVLYSPGHASHHVAFVDEDRRSIFTGDVAAVRLQGFSYVRPPTPPPDLDLELWGQSLHKVQELNPRTLYLTHFGAFRDVNAHLRQARERLFAWGEIVKKALERYELATPYGMTVDGYRRYFRNR